MTLEWRIHLASCADPYILLCTEDDELFLVRLKSQDDINRFSPIKKSNNKVITSTLIDENGDQPAKSISTTHLEVIRPKVKQVRKNNDSVLFFEYIFCQIIIVVYKSYY